jgi:hypothetical protein
MGNSDKYKKVVKILRSSDPKLNGIENIQDNVIKRIKSGVKRKPIPDLLEILFGWIYIRWIRNSMVTASAFLVIFFIFQQTMILKGINDIKKRSIINGNSQVISSNDEFDGQLMILKLNTYRFSRGKFEIPQKQLEKLVESYKELEGKYSDLIKIIDEDPVLKENIEKRLREGQKSKPNL